MADIDSLGYSTKTSETYLMEDWVEDFVKANRSLTKKEAKEYLTSAVACLQAGITNKRKARIQGLGVFKVLVRKAYTAINPSKLAKEGVKESVDVPSKAYVKFNQATSFQV